MTTSALNTSQYVFAKEVRGTYNSATLPPAAVVDDNRRRRDPLHRALRVLRVESHALSYRELVRIVAYRLSPHDTGEENQRVQRSFAR